MAQENIAATHPVTGERIYFSSGTSRAAIDEALIQMSEAYQGPAAQKMRQRVTPDAFVDEFGVATRDLEQGASSSIRMRVGGVAEENRLAAIQSIAPDAVPIGANNFAFTDPETGLPTLYNPRGFDVGDVASIPAELAEFGGSAVGGTIGATGGALTAGPPGIIPGMMMGSGIGGAMLRDLTQGVITSGLGIEDARSTSEKLADTATTFGLNAALPGGASRLTKSGSDVLRWGSRGGGDRELMAGRLEDAARFLPAPPPGVTRSGRRDFPTLSLAQASDSSIANLFQRFLSSIPGGSGVIKNAAQKQLLAMQDSLEQKVINLTRSGRPNPLRAGEAVISSAETFGRNFQTRSRALYNRLNDLIPKETQVSVSNFRTTLDELSSPAPDLPRVSKNLTGAQIRRLAKDLTDDLGEFGGPPPDARLVRQVFGTQDGVPAIGSNLGNNLISFDGLMRIRTSIGKKLSSSNIPGADDINHAQLSRLYGAITRDLRAAAQQVDMDAGLARLASGGRRRGQGATPQNPGAFTGSIANEVTAGTATKTFDVANRFYDRGKTIIQKTLEPLIKGNVPEKVFDAVERAAKEGPTRLLELRRGANDREWKILVGALVNRMGKPSEGAIGSEGASFSFKNFLKSWESLGMGDISARGASGASGDNVALNRRVKDILFSGPGMRGMREDLDALARMAESTKFSSQSFTDLAAGQGPLSGQNIMFGMTIVGATGVTALATGTSASVSGVGTALLGGIILAMAGIRQSAFLVTDRKFVEWAAKAAKVRPEGAGAYIGRLSALAANSDDDTRNAIQEFTAQLYSVISDPQANFAPQERQVEQGAGAQMPMGRGAENYRQQGVGAQ
jgi:hypothetical protein